MKGELDVGDSDWRVKGINQLINEKKTVILCSLVT